MKKLTTLLFIGVTLASVVAWAKESNADDKADEGCTCCQIEPEPAAESWALRGVVEAVLPERSALLVKHEEIPGFMRAMTMTFKVDPEVLPTLAAGDTVTATMKRAPERGWLLEDIKVTDP